MFDFKFNLRRFMEVDGPEVHVLGGVAV